MGCGVGLWQPLPIVFLQVWLPAMKAKGLEISGTFTRQAGSISMDLQLTNKALQVMTDFAIQFNTALGEPRGRPAWPVLGPAGPAQLCWRRVFLHNCGSGQLFLMQ